MRLRRSFRKRRGRRQQWWWKEWKPVRSRRTGRVLIRCWGEVGNGQLFYGTDVVIGSLRIGTKVVNESWG